MASKLDVTNDNVERFEWHIIEVSRRGSAAAGSDYIVWGDEEDINWQEWQDFKEKTEKHFQET